MIRSIFIFSILINLTGCDFDRERQLSIAYPASLIVENHSNQHINLESFSSTPDVEGAFIIKVGTLKSGASKNFQISPSSFDSIKAGQFELFGRCGDIKEWQKPGAQLQREAVENEIEWKITVTITDC